MGFVFGAVEKSGDWFKMVSVDATGKKKECRHTKPSNIRKIGELTGAIWDAANRGGSYSTTDIKTGSCGNGTKKGEANKQDLNVLKPASVEMAQFSEHFAWNSPSTPNDDNWDSIIDSTPTPTTSTPSTSRSSDW